jgi:sialic acid synthase SpsE
MDGPDHELSLEPDTFGAMVDRVREVEEILGSGDVTLLECETDITPFREVTE